MSTISLETREFALGYVQQRFSIFPLKPGSKKPILDSWEPYQRRLASNEQIEAWFSNGQAGNNIAIVTGRISRIIAFDIDGNEALTRFNTAVESLDDEELKTAIRDTMRIRTATGNTNVVIGFRIEEFTSADDNKLLANHVLWTNGKHSEIRVKGEGGYIVAPPSTATKGRIIGVPFRVHVFELSELRWCLDGPSSLLAAFASGRVIVAANIPMTIADTTIIGMYNC